MPRLENIHGSALTPHLDALGSLRIRVFHEFPYLYEGTLEYEREYLQSYANTADSLVVLAFDGNEVIGATTCLPLHQADKEFGECFVKAGYDLHEICYFGESILLPQYRGHGIGKEFFARREAHAQSLGARLTTFCSVDRPADHPLRPADYRPLDTFWTAQGYHKHPELQAWFHWKEIGQEEETAKSLTFWLKAWNHPA